MESEGQMNEEVNAENIKDIIIQMEEHCKNCVADGRFVEAEMSKNRLRELKEQEFGMEYQNLVFQHQ